jgi:hypothetical protein
MSSERDEATRRLSRSTSRLRVVVAGPGTGKTFAFEEALHEKGGHGLAVTFIRSLGADLAERLKAEATGGTFHKYAKHLVHRLSPVGISKAFSLYPPLLELEAIDLGVLGVASLTHEALEAAVQTLDDASGVSFTVGSAGQVRARRASGCRSCQ